MLYGVLADICGGFCQRRRADWGALENLQANDEILLGIVADSVDQLLRLVHGLVGMVVEGAVLHELADGALALIDAGENAVEAGDGVLQLLGKPGIFGQLADRALAGIDVREELVGVGDGRIEVFVELSSLRNLPAVPWPSWMSVGDLVELVDNGIGAGVERVVVDQLAHVALPIADGRCELVEIGRRCG